MNHSSPIALVTGGGRGIGAATALLLAQHGYAVAINFQSDSASAEAVREKIIAQGGTSMIVQADVSQQQDVERLFAEVDNRLGCLTLLVNNAGILKPQMRLVDMDAARINRILQVNVTGTLLCCREAVKRMAISTGGNGGAIVNVSSMASRLGSPFEYIDYAASKGAVDTLTTGLAKEVAADGIRVNAVRPGLIATTMHADGGEPDRVARLQALVPLKRGGQPEEVAEAIAWLASEKASYVTGCFIDVGGGR